MSNIDLLLEKLLDYYEVSNLSELAKSLNTTPQNISKWKTRNSVSAIKKKCRELGIYDEIFGDLNTNIQYVHSNLGNNAFNNFNNHGDQKRNEKSESFDEDVKDILNKAAACINQNNKESFIKLVKSWIVDNL